MLEQLPSSVLRALLAVLRRLDVAHAFQRRIVVVLEMRRILAEQYAIDEYCAEVCAWPAPGGVA